MKPLSMLGVTLKIYLIVHICIYMFIHEEIYLDKFVEKNFPILHHSLTMCMLSWLWIKNPWVIHVPCSVNLPTHTVKKKSLIGSNASLSPFTVAMEATAVRQCGWTFWSGSSRFRIRSALTARSHSQLNRNWSLVTALVVASSQTPRCRN